MAGLFPAIHVFIISPVGIAVRMAHKRGALYLSINF
jgi:hypothetical protein